MSLYAPSHLNLFSFFLLTSSVSFINADECRHDVTRATICMCCVKEAIDNLNLEEIRKSAGMTQLELSESADVSRKSINAIENGIYVPSTVLALKIAKTLGCKVEDLFKLPNN